MQFHEDLHLVASFGPLMCSVVVSLVFIIFLRQMFVCVWAAGSKALCSFSVVSLWILSHAISNLSFRHATP
jgi:hypothetical protein